MRLLLDSHLLLWWPTGSPRLGQKARAHILADDAELFMSAASWWELGIKRALGRLDIDLSVARQGLEARGVSVLPVTIDHAEAAAALPVFHRDPFDHMLVAQAMSEGCNLLTRDKQLKRYGPTVLCV